MRHFLILAVLIALLPISNLKATDLSDKAYKARGKAVLKILHSQPIDWNEFEKGARSLVADFPTKPNGYEDLIILVSYYEKADSKKANAIAAEMAAGPGPEKYKLWAQGYLDRTTATNKDVSISFTAVDGREVDTTKMKGKVVLVDFWATTCAPCVAELPRVKAVYDKYHEKGFEVVGISFDTDSKRLQRFLKDKGMPWPQYNDGKQFVDNKFGQAFGVTGIPHMLLIDKTGHVRFHNVRVDDAFDNKVLVLLNE